MCKMAGKGPEAWPKPFLLCLHHQHPFTTQQLPRALLTQLLDKANDPHLGAPSPEDCELEVGAGSWGVVPWPGRPLTHILGALVMK